MTVKNKSSEMKPWLVVLIALLDDIVVLALVFLVLWLFRVEIPLLVLIIIGLVLGTLIFIVHRAVVPSLRRRKVAGAEGMVGLMGEVVESLKPDGVIRVSGEYWQAKSLEGDIEAGEDVEITGIDRLHLEVRRKAS
jgi:membrane-bound serine protease (ClpP class)